jgi:hypothetical protein
LLGNLSYQQCHKTISVANCFDEVPTAVYAGRFKKIISRNATKRVGDMFESLSGSVWHSRETSLKVKGELSGSPL